jgi:hypothetical protein
MIDSNGAVVPASAAVSGGSGSGIPGLSDVAGVPFSQQDQASQTGQVKTLSTSSNTSTYFGAVTLPSEQQPADSPVVVSSRTPAVALEPAPIATEQVKPAAKQVVETKREETSQYVFYNGILDRFKEHTGSKKLSTLKALFDKNVAQAIHQEPALLVSNGQSKGVLTVDIPVSKKSSLNFAVNGGTLVSFKRDIHGKDRWIVEVLPKSGVTVVTLTILSGNEGYEYPLTVVPPVKTALIFDEHGWNRFLKEVGTAKAPLNDLNKDGVRDYKDEYIFVANCLSNKAVPSKRF